MTYYIRISLNKHEYDSPANKSATIAQLYRMARSVVRFGRRYNFEASVSVYEQYVSGEIGRKLFVVYNREKNGYFNKCRHSALCVYGGKHGYNF